MSSDKESLSLSKGLPCVISCFYLWNENISINTTKFDNSNCSNKKLTTNSNFFTRGFRGSLIFYSRLYKLELCSQTGTSENIKK